MPVDAAFDCFIFAFMKSNRRLILIAVMMVTAQVLITVMVIQWLAMQYREEQILLSGDINRAWDDANQQMLDSMLMKNYINPALDTGRARVQFKFNKITRLPDSEHQKKIFVHISDSVKDSLTVTESISAQAIVLRGVKLFMDVQDDDSGQVSHAFRMNEPDTTVLKSAFQKRLLLIDPNMDVVWDTVFLMKDSLRKSHKINYSYTLQLNDKNLKADVTGFSRVILSKIAPSGIFALLLILLTAAAFIFSYRSLKSQMILNAQRNDFIKNMSHELRTPVATVKVALEALNNFDRSSDSEVLKEYLGMAVTETNRLEMLINRVTDLMTAGDIRLSIDKEDLNHLILEVVNSLKPRLDNENATVELIMPTSPLYANVDSLHLKGVIINLIDNSLKYSDKPAEIEIETRMSGRSAIIKVSDRGPGIPPEYAGKIFEKFFRVPKGNVHNVKGYGLGLAYADMVMKQHGGSITYQPREGGGSTFVLTLNNISSLSAANQ